MYLKSNIVKFRIMLKFYKLSTLGNSNEIPLYFSNGYCEILVAFVPGFTHILVGKLNIL